MTSCQASNLDRGFKEKHNKIRKRGCSSSSSSSLVRRYRFKRAILFGKKGGSSTPVPMWNTRTRSPSMTTHHHAQLTKPALPSSVSGLPCKERQLPVSARQLAATLWEINNLPPSRVRQELEEEKTRSGKEMIKSRSKEKAVSLSRSGLLRPHMSDPSCSPFSERMKGFEIDGGKRRVSTLSHQLQLADYYLGSVDAHSSASLMEVEYSNLSNQSEMW